MSGTTVTQSATFSLSRAARELELGRGEFDLALHLGWVRSVPDEGGGGRRITREEIDRVRTEAGFPETLRARVKAVGTTEGAALMGVTTTRFTRLARLGLVVPVKFYLNRYRVVVWLYLAEELRQFAADEQNAPLLSGRTPESLRDQLGEGLDLRPRNWRGRHMGFLLRRTEDPWARAAVVASLLDPVQVAEIVKDPYERSHLNRLRPAPVSQAAPDSPGALIVERITTADDPDEIGWLRADLGQSVLEAREDHPAPRPAPDIPAVPAPAPVPSAGRPTGAPPSVVRPSPGGPPRAARERLPAAGGLLTSPESARPRRLLTWLRRRSPDARPPTAP
ncbi:hypothetical protein CW362_33445 [Streptomyces populi]|uniref:Uncharacterized protein n=1 Tax=Streptomyces populi TaxID=2058924 RepID=A0A2I0SFL6_9ACTN|nr:DUF6397 family protein [Streptomyces populi]PKT68727.1 hypothetical protein CW362_33445 [Streptomyces populi]